MSPGLQIFANISLGQGEGGCGGASDVSKCGGASNRQGQLRVQIRHPAASWREDKTGRRRMGLNVPCQRNRLVLKDFQLSSDGDADDVDCEMDQFECHVRVPFTLTRHAVFQI